MIEILSNPNAPTQRSYQRCSGGGHCQDLTLDEFKALVTQLYDEFDEDFHNAVLDFSCRVCDEVGDRCYLSQMYHFLIGSTPGIAVVDMDLEGELTTQQFVRDFQCRWQATA